VSEQRREHRVIRPVARQAAVLDDRGRLTWRWSLIAGLAGPVVAAICIAVEPAPADPEAAQALGTLLSLGLLAAFVGAGIAAGRRRPGALMWLLGAAVVSMAMTVACPATGHHSLGSWWFVQLAASAALLVAAGRGVLGAAHDRGSGPAVR
jgi:hypothetical protein